LRLQRLHLLTDRALGDVKFFGSAREALVAGGGLERPDGGGNRRGIAANLMQKLGLTRPSSGPGRRRFVSSAAPAPKGKERQ
jgi:hypothetical protein